MTEHKATPEQWNPLITMKSLEGYKKLRAILLLLAFSIALSAWWFPQKWQACQKMYGNRPAQVFCLLDK